MAYDSPKKLSVKAMCVLAHEETDETSRAEDGEHTWRQLPSAGCGPCRKDVEMASNKT